MSDLSVPADRSAAVRAIATRTRSAPLVVPAVLCGTIVILAFGEGGYYPVAWGWSAVVFAWLASVTALVRRRVVVTRLEFWWLAAWILLAVWTAASTVWSADDTQTMLTLERLLVYVAFALAAVFAFRGSILDAGTELLLAAVATVASCALMVELNPDRFGVYADQLQAGQLFYPIGYWNGTGIFMGMGLLLAMGIASRAKSLGGRIVSASLLPIFAAGLYLTLSRGAMIATAVGLFGSLAADPRRRQLFTVGCLLAPFAIGAWLLALHSPALTSRTAHPQEMAAEGHRLIIGLLIFSVLSSVMSGVIALVEPRVARSRTLRHVQTAGILLVVIVCAEAVISRFGAPWHWIALLHRALTQSMPFVGNNLSERLSTLSLDGRLQLWRAALADARSHPLLGDGAGTFHEFWLAHRTLAFDARDGHSLYLDTLAGLGPVGFVLLIAVVVIPIAAGLRRRHVSVVPTLLGAYMAYIVHTGVDWDWQLPVVTLPALVCAALLLSAGQLSGGRVVGAQTRGVAVFCAVTVGILALIGLISNRAISASQSAASDGRFEAAASYARTARSYSPWSSGALAALGHANAALGNKRAARLAYTQAISRSPKEVTLWIDLAQVSSDGTKRHALVVAHHLDPFDVSP